MTRRVYLSIFSTAWLGLSAISYFVFPGQEFMGPLIISAIYSVGATVVDENRLL